MAYFPVMMELSNRDVLVVGGGEEGAQKVYVLSLFGARITLVAKDPKQEAVDLAAEVYQREYRDTDLSLHDFTLIVAATDDRKVNRSIYEGAQKQRIPVNVVDDTELCTFIFPSIVKEGDVVCAVSSGGKSPYITQLIKERIKGILPEKIGEINDQMGLARKKAKEEIKDPQQRRRFLKETLEKLLEEAQDHQFTKV